MPKQLFKIPTTSSHDLQPVFATMNVKVNVCAIKKRPQVCKFKFIQICERANLHSLKNEEIIHKKQTNKK